MTRTDDSMGNWTWCSN